MPHFHISLQAGNNMILKRMKRRHTKEQAIEFCKKVGNGHLKLKLSSNNYKNLDVVLWKRPYYVLNKYIVLYIFQNNTICWGLVT